MPGYDILRAFDMMYTGKINGYICQGFNPLQSFPNKKKIRAALGKLKFLVVMDPLETETARFWENHGDKNPSDPSKIATEVFLLPTTCFAEEDGSLTNSSRWLQWHWKAADAPGEARSDIAIMSGLFRRMRAMYRKDGGAFPDPILNLSWNYTNPIEPGPDELAKEVNGTALAEVKDASGARAAARRPAARRLRAVARRRHHRLRLLDLLRLLDRAGQHDGAARCDRSARAGAGAELGVLLAGQPPDHVQPRQRRSVRQAVESGEAADPVERQRCGPASTCPTMCRPTSRTPASGRSSCWPKAWRGCSRATRCARARSPSTTSRSRARCANPLHPKVQANPVARVFAGDAAEFGTAEKFPYVATTYRLTEHFHFWTKHAKINAILQPEEFIEIGEALAKEKGIAQGDWVKLSSNRGFVVARPMSPSG